VTPESAPESHNDELRQRVRRALTSGALFLVDQRSRVGRGSGKLCAVCTSAVAEDDVEYEVPGGGSGTVVAHLASSAQDAAPVVLFLASALITRCPLTTLQPPCPSRCLSFVSHGPTEPVRVPWISSWRVS
jgi:hypothetical protein